MAVKKKTTFTIKKKVIEPGEHRIERLNVARLPSGTVINLRVHVFRSEKPGPVVLVMGGVHGDEINGVEIVRRAIDTDMFSGLKRGSVIAIPLLNIYGFINFSRDASEGKDVNRSFPGNARGSLASRVASTLTKNILPLIDFGVDYHTGGGSRFNYPQIRFSAADKEAEALARQFQAPYTIRKASIPKTLRKVALGMGKPILVFEGGESLRFDGFSIEKGLNGLRRLLQAQEMLEEAKAPTHAPVLFNKSAWIRAEQPGIFVWMQQSGAKVSKGEPLGVIHDPYGIEQLRVLANRDGYIIGHNNAPVVNAGDALFHLGFESEKLV